ncbi:FMN-dependent NADH-azoreductase [Clostridium gasigenes]|uniref:FMN-dependent NADH-azoreductase n=1 Tax=Clostridium gasigenes TaxID=94869 RepID=UPI001C0AF827|nr:FMN-dependent NADH-azoreductase [Clostridium gasigenes]MBU3136758.1 FMN-dependent NADH-azoreductase [Clostridium gasigenes]
MSKVLYIKANAKKEGVSRTFRISDSFIEKYKELNPNDEIITLDLYKEGIGFLTEEGINLRRPNQGEGKDHPILKYAYQFAEADKYIIAAPFWNLSFPAILKAYIDYICVTGITFKYTAQGPVGLCQGKNVVHIVGRGGGYSEGAAAGYEMGDRYLRTIFGFLGITDFITIAANKLDVIGEDAEAIVQVAINEAQDKAKTF